MRRPLFGIDPGVVALPQQEEPRVPIGRATEQLDVLPPGRWIVRVEREGYVAAEVPVEIVGGEVTPVEVRLARR